MEQEAPAPAEAAPGAAPGAVAEAPVSAGPGDGPGVAGARPGERDAEQAEGVPRIFAHKRGDALVFEFAEVRLEPAEFNASAFRLARDFGREILMLQPTAGGAHLGVFTYSRARAELVVEVVETGTRRLVRSVPLPLGYEGAPGAGGDRPGRAGAEGEAGNTGAGADPGAGAGADSKADPGATRSPPETLEYNRGMVGSPAGGVSGGAGERVNGKAGEGCAAGGAEEATPEAGAREGPAADRAAQPPRGDREPGAGRDSGRAPARAPANAFANTSARAPAPPRRPPVNLLACWPGRDCLRVAYVFQRTLQVVEIPCGGAGAGESAPAESARGEPAEGEPGGEQPLPAEHAPTRPAEPEILLSVGCPPDVVLTHLALSEWLVVHAGFNPEYPLKSRKAVLSAMRYRGRVEAAGVAGAAVAAAAGAAADGAPAGAPPAPEERIEAMTFTVPGRVKSLEFSPSGQLFLITKRGPDKYFFSRYRFEETPVPPATAAAGLLSRRPGSARSASARSAGAWSARAGSARAGSAGAGSAAPAGSAGAPGSAGSAALSAAPEDLRAALPATRLSCVCLSEGRESLRYQFRTCVPTPSMCICGHYCSYAALENRKNPSTMPFSAYFNPGFGARRDGRAAVQRDLRASLAAQGVPGVGNSALFFEHLACSASEGGNYLFSVSPGQTNLDLYADYSPFASCQLVGRGCLDSNLRASRLVDVALCPRSFGLFAAVNHGTAPHQRALRALFRQGRGGARGRGPAPPAPPAQFAAQPAPGEPALPAPPADALHPMDVSPGAASSLLYFSLPIARVHNRIAVGESCYAYALGRGGSQVLLLFPDRFEHRSCADWGRVASWCLPPTAVGLYRTLLEDYASPELQSFRTEPESQTVHLTYRLSEADATIISLALHSVEYTPAARAEALAEENRRCERAYSQLRQRRSGGPESGSTATGGSAASFVTVTSAAQPGSTGLDRRVASARLGEGVAKEYDVTEQSASVAGPGGGSAGSAGGAGSAEGPAGAWGAWGAGGGEDAQEAKSAKARAARAPDGGFLDLAGAARLVAAEGAPREVGQAVALGPGKAHAGDSSCGARGRPAASGAEAEMSINLGDNDTIDLDALDSNV